MESPGTSDIKNRFEIVKKSFNRVKKQQELDDLESQSAKGGFWQDPQKAGKIMQRIAILTEEILAFDSLEKDLTALKDEDLAQFKSDLQKRLMKLETAMFLSGQNDESFAILSIHSG
ncbi:PCRF domain-containing protein, partial [Candidatus Curtissbacteria bacterium]|nr:PCRF domain-containing protein [Candidatus Curtissbacteria bacterium]